MYKKTSLISRESASALQDEISTAAGKGEPLALDLSRIRIITPSFLDQLLFMMKDSLPTKSDRVKLMVANSPAGFSDRLESIGRYHQLRVVSDDVGDWLLPDEN